MSQGDSTPATRNFSAPVKLALRLGMRAHVAIYRATRGRLLGRMGKAPIMLLDTVGRKSGEVRTTPLLYVTDGEDYVVVASVGGAPKHPAWFLNLQANPETSVEVGDRKINVRAEVASPQEKPRLWEKLIETYPTYNDYQQKTDREIPVIILHPVN